MQRLFLLPGLTVFSNHVYSAYAEVILNLLQYYLQHIRLLCVCRGYSSLYLKEFQVHEFTLRMQRLFRFRIFSYDREFVYSAYAEVIPTSTETQTLTDSLLCVCRGYSSIYLLTYCIIMFTLRMQRLFHGNW